MILCTDKIQDQHKTINPLECFSITSAYIIRVYLAYLSYICASVGITI